jgi:hypothetical protein
VVTGRARLRAYFANEPTDFSVTPGPPRAYDRNSTVIQSVDLRPSFGRNEADKARSEYERLQALHPHLAPDDREEGSASR